MSSVYIATPHTRPFESEYVTSLFQTRYPGGLWWNPLPNRPVDEARNILSAKFLQHPEKPSHILFVDSDCVWHPDALLRLVERDLPVVTGAIYMRSLPPMPTVGQFTHINDDGHHVYEFASTIRKTLAFAKARGLTLTTPNVLCLDKENEADDLWEVDGCGCHFLLIRRDVFKFLHMPYFRSPALQGGEDFYFSRKLKAAGIPIYLDLTIHTGHLMGPGKDAGIRELLSYFRYIDDPELSGIREESWDVG